MPSIASVSIDARLDFSSLNRDFSRLQTDATKNGAKVGKAFGDSLTSSVKAEGGRLTSVINGVFAGIGIGIANAAGQGISALSGLSKSVLSVGADAEKARVQFTTFTGSAQAAQKALADVTKFAANTPFELPEVRKAAAQLLAFGVSANDLTRSLKTVGDVAAATGTPFNELADIYGKLKVQGRAYMEDINQLQGRGIPIIQMLSKQYGVTAEQMKKLVETGRIGFAQVDYALEQSTKKGGQFGNMMEKLSQTTAGKLSNMSDKVTASFESIFTTIQPAVNESIDLVASFLGGMNVDMKTANQLAGDLAKWLSENKDEAVALGQAVSGGVNSAFTALRDLIKGGKEYLDKYPAIMEGFTAIVDKIGEGYQLWGDNLGWGIDRLKEMLDLLGQVAQAAKGVGDSFNQWWDASAQNLGFGGGGGKSSGMIFPVVGGSATTNLTGGGGMFGAHRHYGAHSGQDYAYGTGTAVRAAFSGKIKQKVSNRGEWKLVLEGEVNGKHTEMDLVHLDTAVVNQGQSVTQGQLLGTVGGAKGSWGSTGAHLHMGVRQNGKIIDPRTINFSNAALITNPISGAAVAAGVPVTQAITASTAASASSSGKPPALLPISAEEAKRQRDKADREAEAARREAQRLRRERDRAQAEAASQRRSDRDSAFDIATQRGRLGLSGSALEAYDRDRSRMRQIRQLDDTYEDLGIGRSIKIREGIKGGVDFSAAMKANREQKAALEGLATETERLAKAEEERLWTTNRVTQELEGQRRLQSLTGLMQERESARVRQGLDYAGRRQRFGEKIQELKYEGIERESGRHQRTKQYEESSKRLSKLLEENRLKAKELEIQMVDGVGSSVSNAFKDLVTGTKSFGDALTDLLGDVAGKLFDLGIGALMGGAGTNKGLLGGVFNGLFGGRVGRDKFPNSYAVGTPYVPTNQLAFLHQGEAVIPAKYNRNTTQSNSVVVNVHNAPGEGAMDNNQANKLAEQVRRVVESELLRQRRPGGMMH